MYCHYIHEGWSIKFISGVLFSECPLSEAPLYMYMYIYIYLLLVWRLGTGWGHRVGKVGTENLLKEHLTLLQQTPGMFISEEGRGGKEVMEVMKE